MALEDVGGVVAGVVGPAVLPTVPVADPADAAEPADPDPGATVPEPDALTAVEDADC